MRRAKNLGVASKECLELTQQIVQDVNLHIANKKKMSSQRFLRGDTTWEQQSKDISNAAAKGSAAAVAAAAGSRSGGSAAAEAAATNTPRGGDDPPDQAPSCDRAIPEVAQNSGRRRPWGLVGNSERKRRALMATKPFREVFWPGFRAAIAAFDDDGAPIGDNDLFAILFEYGVRKANTNHRLAPGLSFPECLPDGFVASIEVRGREKLLQQQRRQCRVEAVADWVKAKGMITNDAWNVVRGILPRHVMPSLYQMDSWKAITMQRYGAQITYHKTHCGYQANLRALMPLVFMSNLIKYACGPGAKLCDGVHICVKVMLDGCNIHNLNYRNLVMAHANIAFLPTDRAVWLTDLYPTDEEQRANNPAGQRGISTVTMGLCLGKESFGNVRANFAGDPMVAQGLLEFEAQLPTLTVPRLIELCYAYGVWRGNSPRRQQMLSSLKGFIDRNRAELLAQAFPDPQQLEEECWTTLQKRVEKGDDMFTVLHAYEGAAYTAHLPVMEEVADGPKQKKLVHSRGDDGKALYRVVKGRLGSTFNVDMKMRDLMVRFGGHVCGDGCCSAVWTLDRRPRAAVARAAAGAAAADADGDEPEPGADGDEQEPELEALRDSDGEEEPAAASGPGPAVPEAATALPPRRIRDARKAPRCGRCCPLCDTASHNYRRPLQFLTIEAIRQQMGRPEGALTLREIADFYKISLQQLIRWSTAAFTPDDLLGAPKCSCPFVQRGTFGYTGSDVTSPRKEKHVHAKHLHCSRGNPYHKRQRLLTHVAVAETAGQSPTLGLWATEGSGLLRGETCVTTLPVLRLEWAPAASIPLVLAVRFAWKDEMRRGQDPIHEDALDSRKWVVGMLHSILLALPGA